VRGGQTKLFEKNVALFHEHAFAMRKIWIERCEKTYLNQSDIQLYMHMVSTIEGAEDLYKGKVSHYHHKDELWLYIPSVESAEELLKLFLVSFQNAPGLVISEMEVEFLGDNAPELIQIFKESFPHLPTRSQSKGLPMAVLYYKAGTLNSRKTQIAPFLPKK
jgi:hypothetical protein